MKLLHCGLAALLFSAGCARSSPATTPSPDLPEPSVPAASPTAGGWVLVPDEGFHSYTSRASTTVELQEATGSVRDSFVVTLDFSMRVQRSGDQARITGAVERLRRESENRPLQPDHELALPLSFSGRIVSGGLVLDSAGGRTVATVADCENAGLNQIGVVQRNVSLPPLTLRTGTRWADSSTVRVCSGTIPVELTSVRTYAVLGEVEQFGSTSILVQRSERTRATGEGSQGQHRIGLQAAGTGMTHLYLEPTSGLLKLADGESRMAITVRSSGRLQQFVQVVKETTRLQ